MHAQQTKTIQFLTLYGQLKGKTYISYTKNVTFAPIYVHMYIKFPNSVSKVTQKKWGHKGDQENLDSLIKRPFVASVT